MISKDSSYFAVASSLNYKFIDGIMREGEAPINITQAYIYIYIVTLQKKS